jgi:hypothetical protein
LPWCDDCSKFWNAPELAGDGECPTCGRVLTARAKRRTAAAAPVGAPVGRTVNGPADGELATATAGEAAAGEAEASGARVARAKGAPWHFKLMVLGVAVYMIYRIYWLIEWLPKHV